MNVWNVERTSAVTLLSGGVFVSGTADELQVTAAGSYEAAGQRVSGVKIFWFSALEVSQGPISELTESYS